MVESPMDDNIQLVSTEKKGMNELERINIQLSGLRETISKRKSLLLNGYTDILNHLALHDANISIKDLMPFKEFLGSELLKKLKSEVAIFSQAIDSQFGFTSGTEERMSILNADLQKKIQEVMNMESIGYTGQIGSIQYETMSKNATMPSYLFVKGKRLPVKQSFADLCDFIDIIGLLIIQKKLGSDKIMILSGDISFQVGKIGV